MSPEVIKSMRECAKSYREAATKLDPCGYRAMADIVDALLDEVERLQAAMCLGHEPWSFHGIPECGRCGKRLDSDTKREVVPDCNRPTGHKFCATNGSPSDQCESCGYRLPTST